MLLATLSIVLAFLLLLKLYCRLTVGKCLTEQDMNGKTVLITGASAGLGKETALNLAKRNARVLMACRNLEKAEKVLMEITAATGNTKIKVIHLDLESFFSVRKCAKEVLETEKRLDVLINNAGMGNRNVIKTEDGWEASMQINHLGHFLLTLLLLDLLKRSSPSRIINISSITYLFAILNVEDMDGSKHNPILAHTGNLYFRSKLANILFTKELAKRLDGTGVTVNALHPGFIPTGIYYRYSFPVLSICRFIFNFFGKSPEEGVQTTIYLAVHPDVEKTTGKFFSGCQEMRLRGKANSRVLAKKLFEISENIVGEKYKNWSEALIN